jgi:hypothetical protein
MSRSHREKDLDDDLREVVDILRSRRPTLDPLAHDAIKLRAIKRARRPASSPQKGFFMRSRLTALLTVVFLSLGTGGALACVSWVEGDGFGFGFGGHDGASASCEQYRPGHGYGDQNHCHTGPPGQEGGDHGHEGEPPGHGSGPPSGFGGSDQSHGNQGHGH